MTEIGGRFFESDWPEEKHPEFQVWSDKIWPQVFLWVACRLEHVLSYSKKLKRPQGSRSEEHSWVYSAWETDQNGWSMDIKWERYEDMRKRKGSGGEILFDCSLTFWIEDKNYLQGERRKTWVLYLKHSNLARTYGAFRRICIGTCQRIQRIREIWNPTPCSVCQCQVWRSTKPVACQNTLIPSTVGLAISYARTNMLVSKTTSRFYCVCIAARLHIRDEDP